MRFADVKIGAEYLTKISGALVRVRTEGFNEVPSFGSLTGTKKLFEVVRVDNGRKLFRTAGKLRPVQS